MTYTVERVHSCVAETRQAVFRLTYEVTYIPELNVWRHFLIKEEELSHVAHIPAVVASDAGGAHTGALPAASFLGRPVRSRGHG